MTPVRGSNIGLAGCGMGHKIEAGCGILEIFTPGYGMKISWRDRDALISIDGILACSRLRDSGDFFPHYLGAWNRLVECGIVLKLIGAGASERGSL